MLTVIRCPFCAGMYEVLQPPVSGSLLRCPNCRQTFTFGPPTGATPLGNMPPRDLPRPTAPSMPTPDTPFWASAPSGPQPPAAPVINISIPTITNPNSRPVPSAAPPDLPSGPNTPPGRAGP
jgi:hypothetical protein